MDRDIYEHHSIKKTRLRRSFSSAIERYASHCYVGLTFCRNKSKSASCLIKHFTIMQRKAADFELKIACSKNTSGTGWGNPL